MAKRFYSSLYLIRSVEMKIAEIYPSDKIKSPVHLSIGQEAASVGVCAALSAEDVVFGSYRGHALYLAKDGNLNQMVAELYGKATGCTKGKGGSMHFIDPEHGMMGTSAVVATTIPIAVGYAYGLRLKKLPLVSAVFFGDGAVDEGAFHESMNFAALKRLPVIFICENNFYAIHSHHLKRHLTDNICERARSYGMEAIRIEDNDIFAIHEVVRSRIDEMRTGMKGPFFIEYLAYRWKEHVGPGDDFHLGYRTMDEFEYWRTNDQLVKLRSMLDIHDVQRIEAEVDLRIKQAFDFAESSPFPEQSALFEDLYK